MTRVPGGKSAVTPCVAAKGAARFLDFVEAVFTTEKAVRILNEDGTIGHAEITINGAVIMAFDSRPEWPPTPSFLSVYVDDADAVVARALEAGATLVTEGRWLLLAAELKSALLEEGENALAAQVDVLRVLNDNLIMYVEVIHRPPLA